MKRPRDRSKPSLGFRIHAARSHDALDWDSITPVRTLSVDEEMAVRDFRQRAHRYLTRPRPSST